MRQRYLHYLRKLIQFVQFLLRKADFSRRFVILIGQEQMLVLERQLHKQVINLQCFIDLTFLKMRVWKVIYLDHCRLQLAR